MKPLEGKPPSAEEVRGWLESQGWRLESAGSAGVVLSRGREGVALPHIWDGDPILAREVVTRAAKAAQWDPSDLWESLVRKDTDSLILRFLGPSLDSAIPLGAAAQALRNGKRMLASTGTSVVTPVRSINRHYLPQASELARDALLEHTQEGSFVFPIRVPLNGGSEDLSTPQVPFVAEPFARRATRTLAQSLGLATGLVEGDVGRLADQALDDAVAAGVSRELVQSLNSIVGQRSVEEVQIRLIWGSGVLAPGQVSSMFSFHHSQAKQLRRLARRLEAPTVQPSQVFTGTIREIGQVSEKREFYFSLSTYHRARPTLVRVAVDEATHGKAVEWYERRATVIVRGDLIEGVAQPRVDRPERIQAFIEDRLTDA